MKFQTFQEFYPYYLKQHSHPKSRCLHFVGTSLVIVSLGSFFVTGHWPFLALTPVFGYGFAWYGHLVYEKNTPATFTHPVFSLMADFRMFWEILTGKLVAF